MSRFSRCALRALVVAATWMSLSSPAPVQAADDDVLARVRAQGAVHCAGIVRPGIAVPTIDGKHWYGLAPDVCRAVAAAVFGTPERMTFRPYFDGDALHAAHAAPDDIIFMSGSQAVGTGAAAAATLQLGPVIDHDSLALLVPAAGVKHAAELAHKRVCVEPGSASDRALTRYFARHAIALREHPFQETDEMRQAFGAGNCDALAGPLSTLASVRADPQDGQRADRILPELLADDPIFAATAGDARWSRIIWWTFSALVNAEDCGIGASANASDLAIPGVPPVVGTELGLSMHWASDVLAVGGNYGQLFDRDLGHDSRLNLDRGINALWRDGGLVSGLHVE